MKDFQLLSIILLFSSLTPAQQTSGPAERSAAQQPAASEDRASREDVLALLDTLRIRQTMTQMLEGMKAQGKKSAEAGFRYKLPNATPEQVAKVTSLFDEVFADLNVNEMVEMVVPIYQQHISKSDLRQILAFYQSPVGQRLLAEQPAMMQESMQKSAEMMSAKMPALMKKMDERLAQEFPQLAAQRAIPATKKPVQTH